MFRKLGETLQKSDRFWLRPWNWEDLSVFSGRQFGSDGDGYLQQNLDGVIDTILNFTNYGDRDEVENLIENRSKFYTLYHTRSSVGTGRLEKFEGLTISVGRKLKVGWDRLDLIFEDRIIDGSVDGIVDSVRLYYSPYYRYIERDFDMFYWDSSDRRSLETFQDGYKDSLHFYREKRGSKLSYSQKFFVGNFRNTELPKDSSFK